MRAACVIAVILGACVAACDPADLAPASVGADAGADVPATVIDVCAVKHCDDGNPCTADSCLAGTCQHAVTTVPCDDGDPCTTADTCAGGHCVGQPHDCGAARVTVPGGTFASGCGDVTVPATVAAFQLDRTEVTVAQYGKFLQQLSPAQQCQGGNLTSFVCGTPSTLYGCVWGIPGTDSDPIECVDWFQASAYCAWATPGGRLPTALEFQYAARSAGKFPAYPWGTQPPNCNLAVFSGEPQCLQPGNDQSEWPVCSRPQGNSAQGACDLLGNVAEWCADVAVGTMGDAGFRVTCGGSWADAAATMDACQCGVQLPQLAISRIGFRCARPTPGP